MPISKYKYQIFVKTTKTKSGYKAYYGTDNYRQAVAVQFKLKRARRGFKLRIKK